MSPENALHSLRLVVQKEGYGAMVHTTSELFELGQQQLTTTVLKLGKRRNADPGPFAHCFQSEVQHHPSNFQLFRKVHRFQPLTDIQQAFLNLRNSIAINLCSLAINFAITGNIPIAVRWIALKNQNSRELTTVKASGPRDPLVSHDRGWRRFDSNPRPGHFPIRPGGMQASSFPAFHDVVSQKRETSQPRNATSPSRSTSQMRR